MCCLRFRQNNLVVDGRQMISLVSVHGRGSLFDNMYIASFTFLLCLLDSQVSTLVFFMYAECPVAQQWSPAPVGLSRFVCSLNLWLNVLYVCVAAVDVTRDDIDGSTSVFFRCFVFRVYYHRAEGVHQLVVYVYVT